MKTGTYANASTTAAVAVSTATFTLKSSVAVGLLLVLGSMPVRLSAQAAAQEFVPFDSFLEQTKATVKLESLRPGSRVTDTAALDQMRQHILTMYTGVQVVRSFVRDTDHYDCMPVAKQPTVQILGLQSIAEAPPKAILAAHNQNPGNDAGALAANAGSQQPDADTDSFGNPTSCDAGTVPVRRLTLDEMAQFPTLKDFFQKKPGAQGVPGAPGSIKGGASDADHKDWLAVAKPTTGSLSHKYSYTYSWVNNLGGNAALNLWSPYVNTGLGEVFSLSQEWYVGGSGYGLQTAEVGWQNYPAKYGSEASRLFIYYTADDYNSTGCYNLDCGAFVQVSNSAYLGGSWGAYSTPGGPQYEFSAEFYLYNGNWWLAIQGNWIGYYPGYIYHGGQMSRYAQLIEFGTESVGSTVYPPEGSGYWPAAGWSYAAYQRNLYYINTNGVSQWDGLTPVDPSPACYSIYGPLSSPSSGWSIYFYEGGPGGRGC
jgi:hypothetical protein